MDAAKEKEIKVILSSIAIKLDILNQYLKVADKGLRQQQSAFHDEVRSTYQEISNQLSELIRTHEK